MDDVRLPEFEVYDGEGARTYGRRSAQSGRVEFITRGDRRRVWAAEQKRAIALESLDPSTTPTDVARRYGISSGLLYTWRRQLREGQLGSAPRRVAGFARVDLVGDAPWLTAPDPVPPMFVPSPPAPLPQPPPAPTPPHAGLIEIALPGGASVRVDGSVDGAALRRVLDILEGR
jgi:transposase